MSVSQAQFWDEKFESKIYFGEEPCYWLKEKESFLIENFKGKDALLLADGQGRNGLYLASLGINVLAFDISTVAVKQSNEFAKTKNLTNYKNVEGNLLEFEYGNEKYDLVVSIFTQATTKHAEIHSNVQKCLKKGGYFFTLGYTPKQLEYKTGGPPNEENMFTAELLKSELKELEIIELEEFETVLKEGRHDGISALVSYIGKK
jgi:SAM-dependent methyltransferase